MYEDLYWEFENGNKFSKHRHSYEDAERQSKTLINCSNCINCYNCKNCNNCEYCIFCEYCEDCKHCNFCNECEDCYDCSSCKECGKCFRCEYCVDCQNCRYCDDCGSLYDGNREKYNYNEKEDKMENEFTSLKISELIEILQKYQNKHGDLQIVSSIYTEDGHDLTTQGFMEIVFLKEDENDFSNKENCGRRCLDLSFF